MRDDNAWFGVACLVGVALMSACTTGVAPSSDASAPDAGPSLDAGCRPRAPGVDQDGDGYRFEDGDCNDCVALVSPGALDDPSTDTDEDCDGAPGAPLGTCESELVLDSVDPRDAARAVGLCRFLDEGERGWGVIDARYVTADGTGAPDSRLQYGLLDDLGVAAPRAGERMLALSSGVARAPSDPSYVSGCSVGFGATSASSFPAGLTPDTPSCPGVVSGDPRNAVALEVRVRVPSNALGLRFQTQFFTSEYPMYVCSEFNDFFVVVLEPAGSAATENIVFDSDGNRVSVNNSLLRACAPGTHGGRDFACPLGTGPLADTGCVGSGGTGWLLTEAPVVPGSVITLRFAIWDSGDTSMDSLVLVDAFEWLLEDPGDVSTEPVVI